MAQKVIYEFELPNKTILEIEGEAGKEEEAKLKAREYIATEFAPQPSVTKDILRSIPKGVSTAAIGTAALPSMIQSGAEYLIGVPTPKAAEPTLTKYFEALRKIPKPGSILPSSVQSLLGGQFPGYEQVRGAVEQIPGAKAVTQYEPQTTPGQYAETISEYVVPGGAVAKTFRGIAQALGIGGVAGVVQETQEQLGASPLAAMPLTLATSVAGGYLTSPSRAAKIANKALEGVDDAELAIAVELEKNLKDKFGTQYAITAPELIDNKIIQRLAIDVYGTEEGGKIMYNYLKQRPEQLKNVANRLLDELAENPQYTREHFKKIGTTSQKALNDAKNERTIQSREAGYTIGDNEFIDESIMKDFIDDLTTRIDDLPNGSKAQNKLKNLKRRLIKSEEVIEDTTTNVDVFGRPLTKEKPKVIRVPQTNINNIDLSLKEIRRDVDNFYTAKKQNKKLPIDPGTKNILEDELTELDRILRTNPNYNNAKTKFAELSEEIVDPVERNLKDLIKGDVTPSKVKGFIFDHKKNNANDIRKTYEILNKTDKTAFPELTRVYLDNLVNDTLLRDDAIRSLKSGLDLYEVLAPTKAQQANFNQILKGVADAKGVNPNNLILGWNNFNQVLKRTGKIVNIDSPSTPPNINLLPRDLAQIGSFMWRIKFAGKLDEFLQKRATNHLANVFIKDNSVEELIKLGKTGVDSNQAVRYATNIIAATDPARQPDQQPAEQPQVAIPAE